MGWLVGNRVRVCAGLLGLTALAVRCSGGTSAGTAGSGLRRRARLRPGWFALSVATALVATGCGGATKSNDEAPLPPTAEASAATACGDIFDADYDSLCVGIAPPATELARERPRFIALCESALKLPGEVVTASDLEGCARALKASGGCAGWSNEPAECAYPTMGSLPPGSGCFDQGQCSSGVCTQLGDNTTICGSCAAPTPVGQDCSAADCVGTFCVGTPPTCQAPHYGTPGAACDSGVNLCAPGLTCNTVTSECAVPGGSGAPCRAGYDCEPTLVCSGAATPTCQSPGTAGQPCADDSDCGVGLGCVPNDQGVTQCGTVSWASAGQPCDGAVRCLVGGCGVASGQTSGSPGVCPDVLAEGESCGTGESSATCDIFAECRNGTCTLGVPQSCP